jgi:hypothetical protein
MKNNAVLLFLICGTVAMVVVMSITGKPLKHPATPYGIVNFELANNATDVQNILNAWDNDISQHRDVIADAKKNTWLDFIFIFFYSTLFYFLCKKVAAIFKENILLKKSGNIFAIAAIIAGVMDVGENIGMLSSLYGNISDNIALLTASFSTIKWILILLVIIFLVVAFCYKTFFSGNNKAYN